MSKKQGNPTMVLDTEKKLYISFGVLVVLGGALYLQQKSVKQEAASYTLEKQSEDMPKIAATDESLKKIDKVVITQPPDSTKTGAAAKGGEITLKKTGEEWKLAAPIEAETNQANVKSLLDNIKSISVTERIDPSKTAYDKYKLSDAKAVHAVFYEGAKTAYDLYFGENGSRGQMTRFAGKDGVYAVKGYSSYLFTRDVKGWRDMTLMKLEEDKVARVDIENENGSFTFERAAKDAKKDAKDAPKDAKKDEAKWKAKFKKAKGTAEAIKKFDPAKVDDLIRAYKALNATDFTRDKSAADTGLDKPAATLTFTLSDGGKRQLKLGKTSEGSSRWVQTSESSETWSISSWAADWATAKVEKFQKGDDKDKPADPHGGMPGGMPGMPGGMPDMPMPEGE
jgi:hypothetical protein